MRLISKKILSFVSALIAMSLLAISAPAPAEEAKTDEPKFAPIDARVPVPPDTFKRSGDNEWLSDVNTPAFPFDEMIYSWKIQIPEGEGFRLYYEITFPDDEKSPWLYGGYWGKVRPFEGKREIPKFEYGRVEMDQLLLTKPAKSFQLKLVSEGDKALSKVPMFYVITTNNHPNKELSEKFTPVHTKTYQPKIFNLPLRKQQDSKGIDTPNRCQSAAVSTAMQFFGKPINLEDVIAWTNDPEYDFQGIWPRTVGAATQNGFDAYIDRFRTWEDVKATIDQNRVILASITMPKGKGYIDPPYSHISGHIVAINGWTEDGRVIVTDSYLPRNNEGYMTQWLQKDFEKIWMETKGGVGMVVCPPKDAKIELFAGPVPEFPKGRAVRWDAMKAARDPAYEGLQVLVKGKTPEEAQAIKNAFWDAWYKEFDANYEESQKKGN